ncbi:hemolysin family protein [Oceanobacillus halotolerans]|uniref:hemolysin family protein n=1 Tax=Oceanobacillus halotolerans TaxID=2663380 RepID=UPI0013D782CA|nr:CNNM domain-containing protein [Oceanobacillus halotolerans]
MLLAIIVLIFVSFFFSGSETALTATNKMRVQTKATNGDRKSEKLLALISKPQEFITAILIGNNISNILLPTLVTMLAIEYGFNVALASAILTITIIIVSEVIPKSVAATFPDRISYIVLPVIRFIVWVLKPFTLLLNGLTGFIIRFLSKGEKENTTISKEEFRAMVDIADTEGTFEKEESHRIKGLLDFYNLNVNDALKTPRVDMIALPYTATYEEVRDIVLRNPFTRYPVFKEDMDEIIGIFHSKFLISWSMEPEKPLDTYIDTDSLMVYEFHSIELIFRKMTQEKKHMAIVLDEYGGTEGIITLEDIIEAMIGLEIEDETDTDGDQLIEKLTDTELICNGKIPLNRLNSIFDTEIPEEEDVLVGYLLREMNGFPKEGDTLKRGNITFTILGTEGRTIKRVQLIKEESTIDG